MLKIVDSKEMEEILGVSKVTLTKLRDAGMPHYKLERMIKYNVDDVVKWLESEYGVNYNNKSHDSTDSNDLSKDSNKDNPIT